MRILSSQLGMQVAWALEDEHKLLLSGGDEMDSVRNAIERTRHWLAEW